MWGNAPTYSAVSFDTEKSEGKNCKVSADLWGRPGPSLPFPNQIPHDTTSESTFSSFFLLLFGPLIWNSYSFMTRVNNS